MSCQLLVASCQWEKQKLPHLELATFSWPSHCRSNCDCRRRNQLHGRQFQRAGRDVATLKICCSETPTCKDWKQQAANLKIQYHPIVNGPMISPKRCPTTPARATCEIESKCMGKMPMLLESESQALLQTEKPVVFKTTFAEPLAWERRGPVMGRRRGCSLAILQINLEPYHSLVKELLFHGRPCGLSHARAIELGLDDETGDCSPPSIRHCWLFTGSAVRMAIE
jgi:hypothetical protein